VQNGDIEMPELKGFSYLADWLYDIGLTQQSGMGEEPLPLTEIYTWGKGINITHFEAMTMKNLSLSYLSMKSRGTKPNCPRPFVPKTENTEKKIDKFLEGARFK